MSEVRKLSAGGHHKVVGEEPVTSDLSGNEVPIFDRELTADEEVLAALGYKPEFRREFSLWTTFCVSFAVLGLLPSFASTLYFVRPGGSLFFIFQARCSLVLRVWDLRERQVWSGDG